MEIVRDPRSYGRSNNFFEALTYILRWNGLCDGYACSKCPFHIPETLSRNCYIVNTFMYEVFTKGNKRNAYRHNKIYYSAMLLSCYTEAEKLTYLIQGEINGINS